MVDFGRIVLLATFVWACGGKSVSIQEGDGDDDHAVGGSDGGRGGQAGVAGAPRGGTSTGATGGVSAGGGVGLGGAPGTGGMVIGGQAGAGGNACPSGVFTTISGTVLAPSGELPLYNVIVYEPGGPLAPVREGIECSTCPRIDPPPKNAALTDTRGHFVLQVDATTEVRVVLQTGKWRRELSLGAVAPCTNTELDRNLLRLPRSQAEGHLPRIAVVTGADDSLECMLRRLGIADQEFTTDTGGGAVHLYVGCDDGLGTAADRFSDAYGGAMFPSASELFADPEKLASYDFVLLGCDGRSCKGEKEPYLANLQRYADGGGRLFLDHHQGYWLWGGSTEWRAAAEFDTDSNAINNGLIASVDQTFPKGAALSEWLINVEASSSLGSVVMFEVGASLLAVSPPTQRWLYGDTSVLTMTMNTPLNVPYDQQCGRVTFNDFHAFSYDIDGSSPFPDGCQRGPLSPQEATMVFQLFDFSGCVSSDVDPPQPPL